MEKRIKEYISKTQEWLTHKDVLSPAERERFRQEYLVHLSFYQHERLVHLLVTILFAVLTFLTIGIAVVGEYPVMFAVTGVLMVLLIPYIRHYYFLENSVQSMYDLYEEIVREAVGGSGAEYDQKEGENV